MISMNRRQMVTAAAAITLGQLVSQPAFAAVKRVVLVHGIAQQGRNPKDIEAEWMATLAKGAANSGRQLPRGLTVKLPFYGDRLYAFTKELDIPLASDINARGGEDFDEFLLFQAQMVEQMRAEAGVTRDQVDAELSTVARERGPQNWEWVQAIIKAIDKHAGGLSKGAIEVLLRDVFLYTRRQTVREEIDAIVAKDMTDEPTLVIGHSLGSVIAYSVLRFGAEKYTVPGFITVGSPLAIRAIRDQFRPTRWPKPVGNWFNAYDERDVVALFPLDDKNFKVFPAISNFGDVKNSTDNRHGIDGYLDDQRVVSEILKLL